MQSAIQEGVDEANGLSLSFTCCHRAVDLGRLFGAHELLDRKRVPESLRLRHVTSNSCGCVDGHNDTTTRMTTQDLEQRIMMNT